MKYDKDVSHYLIMSHNELTGCIECLNNATIIGVRRLQPNLENKYHCYLNVKYIIE